MSSGSERPYELALRERHVQLGARMGIAGDWSLPMEYGDLASEHRALRETVAVLDRSHRSRIIVSGTDAHEVIAACFPTSSGLEEGRARRAVAADAAGNISDVVLVARTGGISYVVVGEPGQRGSTLLALRAVVKPGYDARIDDRTASTCLLALAGPDAGRIVAEVLDPHLAGRLRALDVALFELHGFRTFAVRTSDTGEDGFEMVVAPAVALHLLDELRDAGTTLAGHLAQEVCRVEAGIPAFDPDLSVGLSPAGAGLDPLFGTTPGESARMLAGVFLEGAPVLCGSPVLVGTQAAGEVRSCVYSPSLDGTIGLAVLNREHASPGTAIRAAGVPGTVVVMPFIRRRQSNP